MGKKKKTVHSSRIRPPSWDQVVWLIGGGAAQLFILFLMSLYQRQIVLKETVGRFDEIYSVIYSIMFFLGLIGISAIILGLWKIIKLLLMKKSKKGTLSKKSVKSKKKK